MRPGISFLLAGSLLLLGGCKKSPPATGTDGADWTTYGRTTDEQRFSPLTQINEQTVGRLGLLWSRELGTT
jgi:quinohemoprotein ethanol dehydrogenase